jgi:DNA repair exonuclease SbcCD ATPase subunit
MAFDKEQLQQLEMLFDRQRIELIGKMDEQRSDIMADIRSLLQPIKDDLVDIKMRLDELTKTEADDIDEAIIEIEALKKKVKQLEHRLAVLER